MSFKIHHPLKLVMLRTVSLQHVAARTRACSLLLEASCAAAVPVTQQGSGTAARGPAAAAGCEPERAVCIPVARGPAVPPQRQSEEERRQHGARSASAAPL